MNSTIIDTETVATLRKWLIQHELDICLGVEDFGDLADVFVAVVGREPEQ